ncbi:MAG: hypothetical protein CMA64_08540 [Euryarchaeota archaeon]|jgi:hypothetical protein|nr:hypothetical protein [Euryarchaeota archaeon]
MSWKKYFKTVDTGNLSPIGARGGSTPDLGFKNYQSTLPEVYIGHPNRIERYNQYESMDSDSEVNSAIDILAEFCTMKSPENGTPFKFKFKESPTETEVKVLSEQLKNWTSLNDFNKRIFKIFRNTLKYGDQTFIRDPETYEWFWVEPQNVVKVIVNEAKGKAPEVYVLKDVAPNFENLTITAPQHTETATVQPSSTTTGFNNSSSYAGRQTEVRENSIEADHVVHLSLTEGLDHNWPFGTSVLEAIFKVFKQKELLEDAIIIYRVQRAPERRVFYIDVGNMPTHMAMGYVERVKNEIHQRRIPTQSGGGSNMMDATYNPLSINEDYFFPQTAEGRGSKVETLPGGENLGEISDLKYFTNKLYRGLRIPSTYLPSSPDDGSNTFVDGKVGTALIQEHRFNQYCMRLQSLVSSTFDSEFKLWLRWRGVNIDNSIFDIEFNEPQNFASYRQSDIDASRISNFTQTEGVPYISKRFALQRFLGLTEEEMKQNDILWREEQGDSDNVMGGKALRSAGLTPGGLGADLDGLGGDDLGGDLEGGAEGDVEAGADAEPGADAGGEPEDISI